jgi:hypothetical protein
MFATPWSGKVSYGNLDRDGNAAASAGLTQF